MPEYILLMHDDAASDDTAWGPYLEGLEQRGALVGGSAIGGGVSVRKHGTPAPVTAHIAGFIRVQAANLDQAKALVAGNPVYEAGGTVEIRALPRTD
jgi:hypothetical protein